MMRWVFAVVFSLTPALLAAQATSVAGRVHIIWDTDRLGQGAQYFVVPTDGGPALRITPSNRAQAEQLVDMDRQLVQASVLAQSSVVAGEQRAQLLSVSRAASNGRGNLQADAFQDRTYNFATIMCRFADDAREPFSAASLAVPHGSTFPGLRYHYLEMSEHPAIMSGSQIYGWYTLPRPRSGYVSGTSTSFGLVAQECASAAEADVNFADFYGINMQLNGAFSTRPTAPFDTLSFGGSWTMTLDGQTRSWGVTWMSGIHASNYVVLHHEVGHAIGWPHSSGDYGQEYDSRWDLMSVGYITFQAPWGWRGPHTIMSHRQAAGWVAPSRAFSPPMGSSSSVRLARSALSPATGYQLIEVPIDVTRRYVVEARIAAGLDVGHPGPAVIIHEVRGALRSYVVDPDRNANPNDESAKWTVGETFEDAINGFSLRVDAMDSTGFNVTVTRGWMLNVNVMGTGTVTVTPAGQSASMCSGPCTRLLGTFGSSVQLTAAAGPGLQFMGWQGDCTGTGACNVVMNNSRNVSAVFSSAPVFVTTSLSAGVMGANYSQTLQATAAGGVSGWAIRSGTLPTGLQLNTTSGQITGVPEASGNFNVTVAAISFGLETTQALALSITRPTLAVDAVIDQVVGLGSMSEDQRRFLDLVGNRNGRVDIGDVRAWLISAGHLSAAEREAALRSLPAAPRAP